MSAELPGAGVMATQLVDWFRARGMKPPSVVWLPDRETGLALMAIAEKEDCWMGSARGPGVAWVEIMGVRFSWPTPPRLELGR